MELLHSKLKSLVLTLVGEMSEYTAGKSGTAGEGAREVFEYLKSKINEEIYMLYISRCEHDFFEKYRYESLEPYNKGFMEARYFIIRMFNISFTEYFRFMNELNRNPGKYVKNGRDNGIRYA